ncbi:hypothetical protein D187_009060 [Cystobacter fuscus DSM 2262]|uniref:Uncharacterized protein n=1 Tax=Cystobacter fuscus (strain ATCC 25194 / DSM 2262 / NBRC 100088 / M29) TaxID=1242864 RepID=S9Q2D0_CYSF2|nr:hypothetical protein [Cystobacter fuscus]EPX55449.1 hypothetical protein D187_009060 [Cystobacter fuscus DSM 2262]
MQKVIRAGPEACILMLRSTFIPVDMPEADAKKISEEEFRALLPECEGRGRGGRSLTPVITSPVGNTWVRGLRVTAGTR